MVGLWTEAGPSTKHSVHLQAFLKDVMSRPQVLYEQESGLGSCDEPTATRGQQLLDSRCYAST